MAGVLVFLLKGFGTLLALIPYSVRRCLGVGLGFFLRISGLRSQVVKSNLELGYPGEANLALRQELYRKAYEHVGNLVLELLILFGPFRRFVEKESILTGFENWEREIQAGRPVIFLSSHVGNWEVMIARGRLCGIDTLMVTKHLRPEWLHQAVERGRASCGVRATYEPKTLKAVLEVLGQRGTVGIVLDQYAGPPIGVRVPFFGVAVGTHSLVATLAKRTGAAVVPVVNYKDSSGKTVVEIQPALQWLSDPQSSREIALNTAHYAETVEKHVRAHPEQWLWTHRRFKGDLSPLAPEEWHSARPRQ